MARTTTRPTTARVNAFTTTEEERRDLDEVMTNGRVQTEPSAPAPVAPVAPVIKFPDTFKLSIDKDLLEAFLGESAPEAEPAMPHYAQTTIRTTVRVVSPKGHVHTLEIEATDTRIDELLKMLDARGCKPLGEA